MTVAQPSSSARSRRLHPPALPHPVPMPGFSFPQPYPPWRHSYLPRAHFAKGCKNTETATLTTFRINTCKSVSKQRTLTSLRINTYEKHRGGVPQHFHDPGNANSAPSRGFSEMNLPIGVRFHRHVRRLTPLSPVPSLDCAYFPSPRRWYPKPRKARWWRRAHHSRSSGVRTFQRANSFVYKSLPPLHRLFALFCAPPPFVFNRLRPLFRKHPGVGVA